MTPKRRPIARTLHGLYKRTISVMIGNACRFTPSCSDYALEAIERYGWGKGSFLAVKRVCKCHPLHPGGEDPVP